MSQMILVQVEVDELVKLSAERWLEDQGIVPEEAIRIFYQEVVACHGLPFPVERKSWHDAGAMIDEDCYEVSAASIAGVSSELRSAMEEGNEMLGLLVKFKEERAARKAARRAALKLQEQAPGTGPASPGTR